jgi:hypothetical protein
MVSCVEIKLTGGVSKSYRKFHVVVRAGTAEAGRTAKRSVEGSQVLWDKPKIAM